MQNSLHRFTSVYIVTGVSAAFTFLYALNPLVSKPEVLTELATNNIFKIFVLFVAYLIANYYSPLIAILLIACVIFIDADVRSVVA